MALFCLGCSIWNPPLDEPSELPRLRPPASSTTLEIIAARLPEDLPDPEAIWAQVDEQYGDPALRRRLEENGMRCGVAGTQLPAPLAELIEQPLTAGIAGQPMQAINVRRVSLRAEQAREIATSPIRPEMIIWFNDGGSTRGETVTQAQGVLRVRCRAVGEEEAEITVVPEIHHGQSRSRFQPHHGSFQVKMERDVKEFPTLTIRAQLSAGQHFIIGATAPPKGLGRNLFADPDADSADQQLIVMRLVDLPSAELFPTSELSGPVADGW